MALLALLLTNVLNAAKQFINCSICFCARWGLYLAMLHEFAHAAANSSVVIVLAKVWLSREAEVIHKIHQLGQALKSVHLILCSDSHCGQPFVEGYCGRLYYRVCLRRPGPGLSVSWHFITRDTRKVFLTYDSSSKTGSSKTVTRFGEPSTTSADPDKGAVRVTLAGKVHGAVQLSQRPWSHRNAQGELT